MDSSVRSLPTSMFSACSQLRVSQKTNLEEINSFTRKYFKPYLYFIKGKY